MTDINSSLYPVLFKYMGNSVKQCSFKIRVLRCFRLTGESLTKFFKVASLCNPDGNTLTLLKSK